MTNNAVISERQSLLLTVFLCIMNLALGFALTMMGEIMTHIIEHYGLRLYQSGFLIASQTIGGLVALMTGIFFLDRVGKVELTLFLLLVFSVMLGFCSLPIDFYTMISVFFLIGISSKSLEAVGGAVMADAFPGRLGPQLSMMHAFFAVGVFLSLPYARLLLHAPAAWRVVLLLCAAACLIILIFYYAVRDKSQTGALRTVSIPGCSEQVVKSGMLWLLCLLMFLIHAQMFGVSNWITAFMLKAMDVPSSLPRYVLSFYWLEIILGRFFTARWVVTRGPLRPLYWCSLTSGGLLLVGIFSDNPAIFFITIGLAGFFAGGVVPLLITIGCTWFPANSGTVLSILLLGASVAVFVFPLLIEIISELTRFSFGMSFAALSSIIIALLIQWTPVSKKEA